jgi:tetratricopeptide (TPR) repeat protein
MYQRIAEPQSAPFLTETTSVATPETVARLALGRVRKALTAYIPAMLFEPARLRETLSAPLPDPTMEAERLFALGWLHWLAGDATTAEPLLVQAVTQATALKNLVPLAEAAYWRARVKLLLGRTDAVSEYEGVLRSLGGSPQATAWFVDLLGRSGRIDRAEQVWKSVRGNRKVTSCDEGPLLEARSLLRRGELAAAEKSLNEASPGSGVVQSERYLLLAWIAATQKQVDKATNWLQKAREAVYPAATLETWSGLVQTRATGATETQGIPSSPLLHDLQRGHSALLEGQLEQATAAFRAALTQPVAQPFARYALARLGQDEFTALLATPLPLFLAVRCRVWSMLERFRQREAAPADWLDAVKSAGAAGVNDPTFEHFRHLALLLQQKQPTVAELRQLAEEAATTNGPAGRNLFRAALELASTQMPGAESLPLLQEWGSHPLVKEQSDLRSILSREVLRLTLSGSDSIAALDLAEQLLPGDSRIALVRAWSLPNSFEVAPSETLAESQLWQAALELARPRPSDAPSAIGEKLSELDRDERLRPLVRALAVYDACQHGDINRAAGLLEDPDAWRDFSSGPPAFVITALESLVTSTVGSPIWKRALPPWLALWGPAFVNGPAARLAEVAGLTPSEGAQVEAPPGAPPGPWFLHQAARALGRDDARGALAFVRRAQAVDAALAESSPVRSALPELQRRAQAQAVATVLGPENGPEMSPSLLVDAIDLLRELPTAADLLQAADAMNRQTAHAALATLTEAPELPPRLLHHLALLEQRLAAALEEQDRTVDAEPHWRRAWRCWLRYFSSQAQSEAADAPTDAELVFDWLLSVHRRRINELLARNAVDRARRHWLLVQELRARAHGTPLESAIEQRVARFREELATEYLLTTREAMRYGDIAEGMHADYEKGLGFLRRLLSLDHDDVRLLTALVEVCNEWFLDLYNAGQPKKLSEQVERFTPFAAQLLRVIEGKAAELSARAAVADFYKFRGFASRDRDEKVALYREALRLDPANQNVRQLLSDLGEDVETKDEPDGPEA